MVHVTHIILSWHKHYLMVASFLHIFIYMYVYSKNIIQEKKHTQQDKKSSITYLKIDYKTCAAAVLWRVIFTCVCVIFLWKIISYAACIYTYVVIIVAYLYFEEDEVFYFLRMCMLFFSRWRKCGKDAREHIKIKNIHFNGRARVKKPNTFWHAGAWDVCLFARCDEGLMVLFGKF